jgi:hypothetical protein
MRHIKILFLSMPFLLLFSCHWKAKVAVIKNNTPDTITVVSWDDRELGLCTDSMVFNNRIYMPYRVNPQNNLTITLPDRNFNKAPDSSRLDLYIFDLDSLSHYKKLSVKNGILRHSLLKKVEMQVNKIREPIDTIHIDNIR